MTQLKEFEVTYRNKSGDRTTKKTTSQGYSDREVRSGFEQRNYQVISVVYKKMIF